MEPSDDDILASAFAGMGVGIANPHEIAEEIMMEAWGGETPGAAAANHNMIQPERPPSRRGRLQSPPPALLRRSARVAQGLAEAAAAQEVAAAEKKAAANAAAAERAAKRERAEYLRWLAARVSALHSEQSPEELEEIAKKLAGEDDIKKAIRRLAKMKRAAAEDSKREAFRAEVRADLLNRAAHARSIGEAPAANMLEQRASMLKGGTRRKGRKGRKTRSKKN
jgi:hypothetical protein